MDLEQHENNISQQIPLHPSGTHGDVTGSQPVAEFRGHHKNTDSRGLTRRARFYIHICLHEPTEVIQGVKRPEELEIKMMK